MINKQLRVILTRIAEDAAEYFPALDTPWSVVEDFINKNYVPKGWHVQRDNLGDLELVPNEPSKWAGLGVVFSRSYKGRMAIVKSYTLQPKEESNVTK